jgi:hypothetical protein
MSGSGELNKILQFLIPVLIAVGIMGSALILRFRLKSIKTKADLGNKLRDYRNALIVSYAILEGPALFSLIGNYLSGNFLFLGLAGLIIVILFMNKPTRDRVINDLELNPGETGLIDDPDAIIA